MKKITCLFCLLTLLSGQSALAKPATKNMHLAVGHYNILSSESAFSLTDTESGVGASFSPQEALDVDLEQSVLKVDASYDFSKTQSLGVSWYRLHSSSSKNLTQDVKWLDENREEILLPSGVYTQTKVDYDILKLGHSWSFYESDKVQLKTRLGIHFSRVSIDLDAELENQDTNTSVKTYRVSSEIPLPVLGLGVTYNVSDTFRWFVATDTFALKFNDVHGSYTNSQYGLEMDCGQSFSVGASLSADRIAVTKKTNLYRFNYDTKSLGINLFLTSHF